MTYNSFTEWRWATARVFINHLYFFLWEWVFLFLANFSISLWSFPCWFIRALYILGKQANWPWFCLWLLGSIQFLEMSLPLQYYFKIHPRFLSYFYDFHFMFTILINKEFILLQGIGYGFHFVIRPLCLSFNRWFYLHLKILAIDVLVLSPLPLVMFSIFNVSFVF